MLYQIDIKFSEGGVSAIVVDTKKAAQFRGQLVRIQTFRAKSKFNNKLFTEK